MDRLEFRACLVRFPIIGEYLCDRYDPEQDAIDGSKISCGHGRVAHGRVHVCSYRLGFACPQLAHFTCLYRCEVRCLDALLGLSLQVFCVVALLLGHAAEMLVLGLYGSFSLDCAHIFKLVSPCIMFSSLESYGTAVELVWLLLLLKIGRLARGFGLLLAAALPLLGGFLNLVCDDKLVMVAA